MKNILLLEDLPEIRAWLKVLVLQVNSFTFEGWSGSAETLGSS